jgi:hypothetical protein
MGTEALAGLFAGITIVLIVAARVVEYFITKGKTNGGSFTPADRVMMQKTCELTTRLHEQHSRTDEDGTPLWYMPRSVSKQNDKIIEIQQKIVMILDKLSDKLSDKDDRMLRLLEKLDDKGK